MDKEQEEGKLDEKDKRNEVVDAPKTPNKKKDKIKKISESDFKKAENELKKELNKRKVSRYRKNAEIIWKSVDRQVSLQPMDVDDADSEEEWLNMFDTGDLAQASEIMTGDILRVVFPDSRNWFEAHVKPPVNLDEVTGEQIPFPKKLQNQLDGRLRAMMTQQHIDFGLRDRIELSLKEALHHGMFVAEIKEETIEFVFGDKIKEVSAPVWVPHSMWNCYPDPSPSLVGDSMFYRGSMFIRSYMSRHTLMEMSSGEGWIKKALKTVPKRENQLKDDSTDEIEIDTYWGTVKIPVSSDGMTASDSDMFFPNHKAILANGKLVYLDENKTPYPPIIMKGYERMDVRDPYATSPIIKQSPMQDITSILANEFVNGVQLAARPPITYDANDPEFIMNGGPRLSPGAKTATKGANSFQQVKIGDPTSALKGVEFGTQRMKEALGRPGVSVGDRASATEVITKQADSEAGPFAFALKVDAALRTFLHIQNHLNTVHKNFKYSYYNQELDSPDWLDATSKQLPDEVHFEVVGTKGILGEAKRQQAFSQVNGFLLAHPTIAPMLETGEIVKQMYQDAGQKNPERFLKQQDSIPPDVKLKIQQMDKLIQDMTTQLDDAKKMYDLKAQKINNDHEAKMTKIQSQHANDIAELHLKADQLESNHKIALGKQAQDLHLAKMEEVISKFEAAMKHTVATHKNIEKTQAAVDAEKSGAMGIDIPANPGDNINSEEPNVQ